jgi:hypothetical protein
MDQLGLSDLIEQLDHPDQLNIDTKLNLNKFVSCKCEELNTWHPGRFEHKLKCPKFWSLNPNRTKEELAKYEGFA